MKNEDITSREVKLIDAILTPVQHNLERARGMNLRTEGGRTWCQGYVEGCRASLEIVTKVLKENGFDVMGKSDE